MSKEEVEEEGHEGGWIEWEFTPDARRLIQESETYAVLNRQAVLGFRSTYALRLYEMGALRIHRRQSTWKGDVTALRAALGIDPDVYKDFAQLRRKVLTTAKAEIDQLAHFTVEWKELRRGRAVAELEIRFHAKDAPQQISTVDELARHSSGRKARRESGTEAVVNVTDASRVSALPARPASQEGEADGVMAFPQGSLHYAATQLFRDIARTHGGGWDIDLIAAAYREHMGERLRNLSGNKLKQSWTGFCESYASRRGRP
jgi:hypothetical protein